jgi:hypothetical protein
MEEDIMRRWWLKALLTGLVIVLALAACGGGDDDGEDAGGNGGEAGDVTAPTATNVPPTVVYVPSPTPRPPAPRSNPVPEGEPYDFEAPFSVGEFVRQTVRGKTVSIQTGGQTASYQRGTSGALLTVYYFEDIQQAIDTVRFALEGGNVAEVIGEPYFTPNVSFGQARTRQNSFLAAWSNNNWCYLLTVNGTQEDLAAFLEVFPY